MKTFEAKDCVDLFEYRGGELYWRERGKEWFANEKAHAAWNSRFPGTLAGSPSTGTKSFGRFRVNFCGKVYWRARLVWALFHGHWPDCIDHINGNGSDDRIENLRNVNHKTNHRNRCRPRNNTSGHIGVFLQKKTGRWAAQIKVNGAVYYLGAFDSIEHAARARRSAEKRFGFHPNHGREAA